MEKENMNGILRLKEEIDQTSDELRKEASRIKGDVIAVRNDPKV